MTFTCYLNLTLTTGPHYSRTAFRTRWISIHWWTTFLSSLCKHTLTWASTSVHLSSRSTPKFKYFVDDHLLTISIKQLIILIIIILINKLRTPSTFQIGLENRIQQSGWLDGYLRFNFNLDVFDASGFLWCLLSPALDGRSQQRSWFLEPDRRSIHVQF